MSHFPAPQATADACLRAALRAGAVDARAHGLVALILALLLRLLGAAAATWDLSPDDDYDDEYDNDEDARFPAWRYAEGRHALVMPPMGRAPHAACIEAGLAPDWVLPGVINRGMRPATRPSPKRARTLSARAPPKTVPLQC